MKLSIRYLICSSLSAECWDPSLISTYSLLFFLGAAVNAIEMATPSSPWISGESVTETWTSQSGDPASFALVMNGNDETLLIEELVQTSLGTYTFAVPNVTGYVIYQSEVSLIF